MKELESAPKNEHFFSFSDYCQGHKNSQGQKLKEKSKSNFQTRNKIKLCNSETKTQEENTRTRDVQDKCENKFLLC